MKRGKIPANADEVITAEDESGQERTKKMKRRELFSAILLYLAFALFFIPAVMAENFWQMYWKPGECKVSFTPEEDALIKGILEEAETKSEGTIQRKAADESESVEAQYERFLEMNPEGTPMGTDEIVFDDKTSK